MELGFHPEETYYAQQVLPKWYADDENALEYVDEHLQYEVGKEIIKSLLETGEPYVIFVQKIEEEPFIYNTYHKIIKYEVLIKRLNEHNKELLSHGGM